MKIIYTVLGLSFFLIGCEEQISNITLEDEKLVIEGYLYAGEPIDSIRFTKVQAYSSDGVLETVDDLEVIVENGIDSFQLIALGDGYYSYPDHKVLEEKTYTITTEFDNELVTAETFVLKQKEIEISKETVFLKKIESNGGFP